MIQFDEHIFQMGWFNHQLVDVLLTFDTCLGDFVGCLDGLLRL